MSSNPTLEYPTPPTTRRSGQCSEEYESCRGPFGVSNVQFRAGAPPLRQLPLVTNHVGEPARSIANDFGREIEDNVYNILKKTGLFINQDRGTEIGPGADPNRTVWFLCSREIKGVPYSSYPTLVVLSPWAAEKTDVWQNSARDLKKWLDEFLDDRNMSAIDVHVEIMDKWLYQTKYIAPIVDRTDLDENWESIKGQVRHLLNQYETVKEAWNCIALFHCGNDHDARMNPPTVYISFDRDCDEVKWAPFRQALQQYLSSTPYNLRIHLEHSAPEPFAAFDLRTPDTKPTRSDALVDDVTPADFYQTKLNMGADISANTYTMAENPTAPQTQSAPSQQTDMRKNSSVGTLGCYIQLLKKGTWHTFILSNYHVVRPAIEGFKRSQAGELLAPDTSSALFSADLDGFGGRRGNAPSIGMESPSRARHNKNVTFLEESIITAKDENFKQLMRALRKQKIEFFDQGQHFLGSIVAGSGFLARTPDNGMLDWVIIKPEANRIGLNTLPLASDWPKSSNRPEPFIHGTQLREHVPASRITGRGENYFKYGAGSKATAGQFSLHKPDVKYKDWSYLLQAGMGVNTNVTTEAAFIRSQAGLHDPGFGSPGDSGSIVWNGDGNAVGLLFRGQMAADDKFTYVTPLEHVFEHIKSFLGAEDVRILK